MCNYPLRKSISLAMLFVAVFIGPTRANDTGQMDLQITVAAGSIGGSYYVMNAAMFDIFSKNISLNLPIPLSISFHNRSSNSYSITLSLSS